MPRFDWSRIPAGVIDGLIDGWEMTEDTPIKQVRKWYGARPGEYLVEEAWDVLRETWLAEDGPARRSIVAHLVASRIGKTSLATGTKSGDLRYLRTCKNAGRLRRVVIEEFLQAGDAGPVEPTTVSSANEVVRFRRFRRVEPNPNFRDTFQAHDHQEIAWKKLSANEPLKGALLVLPTGGGKTVTAVRWLLRERLSEPAPRVVLWVAHRAELLEQAAETFERHVGLAIRQNPLEIRCLSSAHGGPASTLLARGDVFCATINMLRNAERTQAFFVRHPDAVIVIDEAHHAAARTYRDLLAIARKASKKVEVLGLTATPTRTVEEERGLLLKAFPQRVIYRIDQAELITKGILAEPYCSTVDTGQNFDRQLSAAELRHLEQFGDLAPKTLERIAQATSRNKLIVDWYSRFRSQFGQTLAFAANVAHCYTLAKAFQRSGVKAGYVAHVRDDRRSNDDVLADFRAGRLDVLVNVTMLTEGVDIPAVSTVFLTRPTGSEILLSQMIGRGMRGGAAGGTDIVRLVSFDDHWARFPNWLDPLQLLPGAVVEETPARPPIKTVTVAVPWSLFLELARMSQLAGPVDPLETTASAIGWYDLRDDADAKVGHVLVFDTQAPGYEALAAALENEERVPAAHEGRLRQFFADTSAPLPSDTAVSSFVDYMRRMECRPPYVAFTDAELFDPAAIARRLADVTGAELATQVAKVFHETLARVVYRDVVTYGNAVFAALLRMQLKGAEFDDRASRDLTHLRGRLEPGGYDLVALRDRVYEEMRLKKTPPEIRWSERILRREWAFYREDPVIVVNRVLDTRSLSERTLEFLVYHELLHHELGLTVGHRPPFREREHLFMGWMDADAELDTFEEQFEY